jgi:hypothetical protein
MGNHHFGRINSHLLSTDQPDQPLEPSHEGTFDLPAGQRFFVIVESMWFGAKEPSFIGAAQRNKYLIGVRKTRVKDAKRPASRLSRRQIIL